MSYKPNSLVQWSWAHPPTCLSPFSAVPIKEDTILEEHESFSHFALTCMCGGKEWIVLGYLPEPELFLCPLSLKCTKCAKITEIFDIERHGYDAELGNGCYSRRAEGEQVEFSCPTCGDTAFETAAVVSYQLDESEMNEEDKSKVQDLFDTFYLSVRCTNCGSQKDICDYECA